MKNSVVRVFARKKQFYRKVANLPSVIAFLISVISVVEVLAYNPNITRQGNKQSSNLQTTKSLVTQVNYVYRNNQILRFQAESNPQTIHAHNQVNQLLTKEVSSRQEGEKIPWYREPSNISIASFIVSLVSLLLSYFTRKSQINTLIDTKKERLDQCNKDLEAIETSFKTAESITDPLAKKAEIEKLNGQRAKIFYDAKDLVLQLSNKIDSIKYRNLAKHYLEAWKFSQAEEHYKNAVQAAQQRPFFAQMLANKQSDIPDLMPALRDLAHFYFERGCREPGHLEYFENGRDYYGRAVKILESNNDDTSIYELISTYVMWGEDERFDQLSRESLKRRVEEKVTAANKHYERLSKDYPHKQFALEQIKQLEK